MAHEKSITLKQLRALSAIIRAGNLTAAAELLHVTPPAISTQLKQLEGNFGIRMLDRGPDGAVALTPPGEEVLAAIEEIDNRLNLCFERVGSMREGRSGRVAVGVVSTGKYFAPTLVVKAQRRLAGIDISLMIGNRGEIINALRMREIDVAVMGRPPRDPRVEATPLGDHPHVLIVSPDHWLCTAGEVNLDRLFAETFLCREPGSGTRIIMTRYLDTLGDGRTYRTHELASNETIKQAAMAGLGIGIISAHTVLEELHAGRLVEIVLDGLPLHRHWFLVHLERIKPGATVSAVIDFISEHKDELIPVYHPEEPRRHPRITG